MGEINGVGLTFSATTTTEATNFLTTGIGRFLLRRRDSNATSGSHAGTYRRLVAGAPTPTSRTVATLTATKGTP